jgi:23S rRNA pseudouridine2605 synthase
VSLTAAEDGSRIRKFIPKPGSKIGTGLRSKPSFGAKPAFGARSGKPAYGKPAGDRERRPFKRDGDAGPTFNKPWQEDRATRAPRPDAKQGSGGPRTFTPRPARPFGERPSAGGSRPGGFAGKPRFDARSEGGPRKTFSKPGTFGRKREGFADRPAPGGADRGESRPPRRDFGDSPRPSFQDRGDRGQRPAAGGFKRPGSYSPRPSFGAKPGFGSKPSFGGPRPDRGERPSSGGFAARKPFPPREGGDRPSFDRKPSFGAKPSFSRERPDSSGGEAPRKVFRKFDAPRGPKPFGSKPAFGARPSDRGPASDRPSRPFTPRTDRPSFGAKPGGPRPGGGKSFGDRKPSAFAGKGGPFAKFADGKKPFRKPGPGKPAAGGFTPTRRKRPEDEA